MGLEGRGGAKVGLWVTQCTEPFTNREGQERKGQREGRGGETPPSDCSLTTVEMQINRSSTAFFCTVEPQSI